MYEKQIVSRDEGQRLDKFLLKLLPNATSSFLYKMLRKKNITLNDKKASGTEKLVQGDSIKIYFSNETLEKFMGRSLSSSLTQQNENKLKKSLSKDESNHPYKRNKLEIIYEDSHFLFLNKPVGMLSQKAKDSDYSVNEWLIDYLYDTKQITDEDIRTFRPSICNRLDRNTSGLILCAKTIKGAQFLSDQLQSRTMAKYYLALVHGKLEKPMTIRGYLVKDNRTNQVTISKEASEDASYIETSYEVLYASEACSCLKVHLITGKTHQIRAHLSSIGHPIVGDSKYGGAVKGSFLNKYMLKNQLLHAYQIVFPEAKEQEYPSVCGHTFYAAISNPFNRIIKDLEIKLEN